MWLGHKWRGTLMKLRPFRAEDLDRLIELTIDTFAPFHDDSFRRVVGDAIWRHEQAQWREAYRSDVPTFHDPDRDRYVAVAERQQEIAGYVAWRINAVRRHGEVYLIAVAADHRGAGIGARLCEHAFSEMKAGGVEVVEIGTGGDPFHAPARAMYESLGCTPFPTAVYYKHL
jgi:ribosomal protein S18 acetylase RimI-like enzyme